MRNTENYLQYTEEEILFHYLKGENTDWIYNRFQHINCNFYENEVPYVCLNGKLFMLSESDLKDINEFEAIFVVGKFDGEYYVFNEKIIRTKFPFKISKDSEMQLSYFQDIYKAPVIKILQEVVKGEIKIGNKEGEISLTTLKNAKCKYPNENEIKIYIRSRIANVISDELEIKADYDEKLKKYIEKRAKHSNSKNPNEISINELEIERLNYAYNKLNYLINNRIFYDELVWQKEILKIFRTIYPQYIRIIHNVKLNTVNNHKKIADFLIINSSGYVDIIEVKTPDKAVIIKGQKYRNNCIPSKELSNSIIQIENYLYSLNTWGQKGEEILTEKYKDTIPKGIKIKISNPRGLLIMGLSNELDAEELFALELTKRHYTHVVDIITYDDMLKRIETLIEAINAYEDIIVDRE
jgi:hypothetical protein